jgi:hypothetical protein
MSDNNHSNNSLREFPVVLLCDDIRKEVGNKRTVVGVFSGDVLVGSFPAVFPVAIYLHHRAHSTDEINMEFEYLLDEKSIVKMTATLIKQKGSSDDTVVDLPKVFLTFERPGNFNVDVSIDGKRHRILSKKIMRGVAS